MKELVNDLQRIKDIDWDYSAIEELINKYKNTRHNVIKEELYDKVNNWFSLLAYDYECDKVKDNKQDFIKENLLFCLDLMNNLKSDVGQDLDKSYYLKEIATLETNKSEKEKWLQEAYHTIEKAIKINGKDLELMFQKISLLLLWEELQYSAKRRQELDTLVAYIINSLESYSFLRIMQLIASNFWMHTDGSAVLGRMYFKLFLERIELMFSKQPELRLDFVNTLAGWHYDEDENALQNLQLITTNSQLILDYNFPVFEKHKKVARELLRLVLHKLTNRKWKMKIGLLAEEFFKLLHDKFPGEPKYISDQVELYNVRIKDALSESNNMETAKQYFKSMHELINQSLSIDIKWEASSYANKLKKNNALLFGNSKQELNQQAIELYHRAIENSRAIAKQLGTEVYSFSTDDRNNLAECYLLQGDSEKAWEVVQEHAAMLEKQKKEYEDYAQYDIMSLLGKKEFEPIHEKIKSLSRDIDLE
jgi:hypothetical protein